MYLIFNSRNHAISSGQLYGLHYCLRRRENTQYFMLHSERYLFFFSERKQKLANSCTMGNT